VFLYNTFGFDQVMMAKINHGGFRYTIANKTYTLNHGSGSCYQNNQGNYQGVAGVICTNSDNYFFYDRIHTTTNVNYLLAKDVYQQYQTALTPK
jgi:phospholipase/lecithinase/hemolysin